MKRVVKRFFSALNLTLYFSFTGAPPLDPAGGLPSLRPPDSSPPSPNKFSRAAYAFESQFDHCVEYSCIAMTATSCDIAGFAARDHRRS